MAKATTPSSKMQQEHDTVVVDFHRRLPPVYNSQRNRQQYEIKAAAVSRNSLNIND